jgi:bifunctional non-homologous end joining protein LigD
MTPDLRPMLATLTDGPFDDPGWVFETKWDGFRAIAVARPGHASLYSRRGHDVSAKYPTICAALDRYGRSRFQLLQNAGRSAARLLYCVFDLLYCDGRDLRGQSLLERKEKLAKILPKSPLLLNSAHLAGAGIKAFKAAKRAGEEGVMAKLASGRYHSGERTREWLKVKANQEQEVVIVGFTPPRRSRKYFGALLLAVREGKSWKYAGRAGTGFDAETLHSLYRKMVPLITKTKPIAAKVPSEAATTWVKPKLVAEVKFTEWTAAGEMRHPVFLGLRTDKKATEPTRERARPLRKAKP